MTHKLLTVADRYRILKVSVSLLVICHLGWSLCPAALSAAQNGNKIINESDVIPGAPVKIVNVRAANKDAQFGNSFAGDNDWLRDMEVRLKNVSDKDIVCVELYVLLPETQSSGNEMVYVMSLGNKPGLPVANAPLLLSPNREATFNLNGKSYQSFLKFLNYRHRIEDINRVDLRIGFVVFADSTGWSNGLRFKQSPENPRRWIPDTSAPQ